MLNLPTMPPTVVLLTLTKIVSSRRNPSLKDGGNNRAWSGVVVVLPCTRKDGFKCSEDRGREKVRDGHNVGLKEV